jgi:hypothetical protein
MSDRTPDGKFQKGLSGNPGGRPKTPPEVKAMFEAKGPEAFELLSKHLDHKDPRIAQAAAIAILDRAYGKPLQQIEQNTTLKKASELTNDELAAIAAGRGPVAVAPENDQSG